jgi:hypothetical protein
MTVMYTQLKQKLRSIMIDVLMLFQVLSQNSKLTRFLIYFARAAYFRVLYVSSYELLDGDTFAIITV